MIDFHVPNSCWADALLYAAYLINKMPSRILDFKTPLEVCLHLYLLPKVFGCVCFVHIYVPLLGKLDHRALKCISVGYSLTHKGYKCYHPPSRKRFVSMDVTFFELHPYFSSTQTSLKGESLSEEKLSMGSPLPVLAPIPKHDKQHSLVDESPTDESCEPPHVTGLRVYLRCQKSKTIPNATFRTFDHNLGNSITTFDLKSIPIVDDMNLPIAQRKGVRSCIQHPISNFVSYQHLSSSYRSFVSKLFSMSILLNLQEAISDPKWRQAMQEEMRASYKNNTWELVKLPSGKGAVGC
jgi:hypothetical protein